MTQLSFLFRPKVELRDLNRKLREIDPMTEEKLPLAELLAKAKNVVFFSVAESTL